MNITPYEEINFVRRDAVIGDPENPVFEQKGVVFPDFWSQNAVNIVAQKYFKGQLGTDEREYDVRDLFDRVINTLVNYHIVNRDLAEDDLEQITLLGGLAKELLANQVFSFNSPVWFNLGLDENPQCSACFILAVEDNMPSILNWYKEEGMIFKGGSGSGINLSTLRSSKSSLSKGGIASGPVSFMRGADASAGTIKSGGKNRRAAKMVVLNADHDDIEEFIWSKYKEQEKAQALADAGFDMSLNSDNWNSIQYQNANNSVRVSDEFMEKASDDMTREQGLLNMMAEAAHFCADPGVQFDTTINEWHTIPAEGRINASNPCSEYMSIDNSACNLASINLLKFWDGGHFNYMDFAKVCSVVTFFMDTIVSVSSYPTGKIEANAKDFRQLGLGYTNLGALIMRMGHPYGSAGAITETRAITAVMNAAAAMQSGIMARSMGPYKNWSIHRDSHISVLEKHLSKVSSNPSHKGSVAAREMYQEAIRMAKESGLRNSQLTVLAPTGTISFMMDAETTGIEPEFSLLKTKTLVGGGTIETLNPFFKGTLERNGIDENEAIEMLKNGEPAQELLGESGEIFNTAVGANSLHYMAHLHMMAAAQPHISGAISKTINLPNEATVEDIKDVFFRSWELGLKAIAVYRDGSKTVQPLNTTKNEEKTKEKAEVILSTTPLKRPMPLDRKEIGRKFQVADRKGYIHVGLYPDGSPGDIFVDIAKEGSTLGGLMNALMISVSIGLQHGVPLEQYVEKLSHMRFEPQGFTNDPEIRTAKSIVDYIAQWLGLKFVEEADYEFPEHPDITPDPEYQKELEKIVVNHEDSETICPVCDGVMARSGSCYTCPDCGETTGCG